MMIYEAIPSIRDLARAEFATIRLRLLKVAVRVQEYATRICLVFPAGCPDANPIVGFAAAFRPRAAAAPS